MERLKCFSLAPNIAGPVFMLGAALLFTLMSVLVKLLPQGYTIWHIGFIRFSGGLFFILLFSAGKGNPFKGHNIPLLIFRGIIGSLAFLCISGSIRILPLSTATVLFFSFPAFAAIFGFLIHKEGISPRQIACITALMAGVAVLFDFEVSGSLLGQTLAIAGALFAGLTATLIRSLIKTNGVAIIYLYFCAAGILVTLVPCLADPVIPANPAEWMMVSGITVSALCAQLLMNQGYCYCKGFEGGVYMSTETVFTAMIGILCMNDPVTWRFLTGSLLIIGAGLALKRLAA